MQIISKCENSVAGVDLLFVMGLNIKNAPLAVIIVKFNCVLFFGGFQGSALAPRFFSRNVNDFLIAVSTFAICLFLCIRFCYTQITVITETMNESGHNLRSKRGTS